MPLPTCPTYLHQNSPLTSSHSHLSLTLSLYQGLRPSRLPSRVSFLRTPPALQYLPYLLLPALARLRRRPCLYRSSLARLLLLRCRLLLLVCLGWLLLFCRPWCPGFIVDSFSGGGKRLCKCKIVIRVNTTACEMWQRSMCKKYEIRSVSKIRSHHHLSHNIREVVRQGLHSHLRDAIVITSIMTTSFPSLNFLHCDLRHLLLFQHPFLNRTISIGDSQYSSLPVGVFRLHTPR